MLDLGDAPAPAEAVARRPDEAPRKAKLKHVALIGTFTPRRCGIATFTADVHASLATAAPDMACDVIAISDGHEVFADPVKHVIRQDEIDDYASVARAMNAEGVELLCVQHEFGIFGGPAGDYLLTLLDALECPVVMTFHTVLQNPNPDQMRVVTALLRHSSRVIVMAERGRRMLIERYNAPPEKIAVIPHGAPDWPCIDPNDHKGRFGLEGRDVLMTFGLLSPNKGIESVIRALPHIAATRPNALYVVLGATHPKLVEREGEAYRDSLIALARGLGVEDNIRFENAFLDIDDLLSWLAAADVYVTPYLNEAQITSGTLAYAVAMGKPVVSTPYWHAQEIITPESGVLVDFNNSDAFAVAIADLLCNHKKRDAFRARAYAKGRETIWPRSAQRYTDVFARAAREAQPPALAPATASIRALIPPMNFAALVRMSDQCGMLQHARHAVPDRNHGYCVDDNCRALILTLRARQAGLFDPQIERLAPVYAAFVEHAWNGDRGRFRNFMGYGRNWLEETGSEDSFGRSFWSLGEAADLARDPELRDWAIVLAEKSLPHIRELHHLRAWAFSMLGLTRLMQAGLGASARTMMEEGASRLMGALERERRPGWTWFDPVLSYENARLPEALLRAGRALRRPDLIAAGLETLRWLSAMQTGARECFRPVGNRGFDKPYTLPATFDQQPVEAAATIDAAWAAFDVEPDAFWREEARRAFAWFYGKNDLGVQLVAADGSGCYDGLTETGVNRNQGAESILSLQLAHCAMKLRERGTSLAAL